MRKTSIDVYHKIKENGLLSKMRWEVYDCLYQHGPLSQNETSYKLRGRLDWGINPRFSELEKMGAIEAVGERSDRYTNNNVLIWDVTDSIPIKLEKNKYITPKDAYKIMQIFIREACEKQDFKTSKMYDKYKELWKFLNKKLGDKK